MVIKLLALDKYARAIKIIMHHGGPISALLKLWRTDTLKLGKFVGTDSYGNNYFENAYYMIGRSRWVEFNPAVKWEYDASQISAEWFGWLHYKTDRVPSDDCAKYTLMSCCYVQNWLLPHMENVSGTDQAFYPYSTIRPRLQVWDGTVTLANSIFSNQKRINTETKRIKIPKPNPNSGSWKYRRRAAGKYSHRYFRNNCKQK